MTKYFNVLLIFAPVAILGEATEELAAYMGPHRYLRGDYAA